MANTVPASPVAPDVGLLMAGNSLRASAIKTMPQASNFIHAHVGSGTPVVMQSFPRQHNSVSPPTTGVLLYNANSNANVCRWHIPNVRGATSVNCYVYASSVGGLGKVQFSATAAAASTAQTLIPSTTGALVGPIALTIDASGGYEEILMKLDGSGGGGTADITLDAVMVIVPPQSSPLAAGVDSLNAVAFDANEHDADRPFAADAALQLRTNLAGFITVPKIYWSWSGLDNCNGNPEQKYMRSVCHVMPAVVWRDTADESLEIQVHVYAVADVADTAVRIHAHSAFDPGYTTTCELAVPAASGTAWRTGTIQIPSRNRVLRNLPRNGARGADFDTILLSVWPAMTAAGAQDRWQRRTSGEVGQLSTAKIRSLAVWGR